MAATELVREPLLLAAYIRERAAAHPERIFCSSARTHDPNDGFVDISHGQLQKGIDFASHMLEEQLGLGTSFDTIGYIGPSDARYLILSIAASQTGRKLFVPSPRNSLEAQVKLAIELECEIWLHAEDSARALGVVDALRPHCPVRALSIAPLERFLDSAASTDAYPHHRTFRDASLQPFMVFHTSGTTGLPKPVVIPHGFFAVNSSNAKIASLGGTPPVFDHFRGHRVFASFPLFHAAGFVFLFCALYHDYQIVLVPHAPPSGELFQQVHLHGNIDAAFAPPSILAEMSKNPQLLDVLGNMKLVVTGGGPLPKIPGDIISARTHVVTAFGTTEGALLINELLDPADWAYIKFSPFCGVEMRPYANGLFESVMVRKPELKYFQAIFYTFPHLTEYSTKDLWSKHPHKEGLWLHEMRLDDIVIYSTGEKLNPTSMEGIIAAHPHLSAALITGQGHFQSVLLLEPSSYDLIRTEGAAARLLEDVWPFIDKANDTCPGYGRIEKGFVLFTTPDRPLPKASKGTVQRRLAETLYQVDVDRVCNLFKNEPNEFSNTEQTSVRSIILETIRSHRGCEDISSTDNIFNHGFDSLGVQSLVRTLNALEVVQEKRIPITAKTIYSNPTVDELTTAIKGSANGQPSANRLETLYRKYIADLPLNARAPRPATSHVVLLTGSTGSLGTYVLHELLTANTVAKVYCLNRGHDTKLRQHTADQNRGIFREYPHDQVEFLDAVSPSPTCEYLGLPVQQYRRLLHEVTLVIHNAWHVDFNLPLSSYADTHVRRTRQLIEFASSSLHEVSIHFVSTIGTVLNYPDSPVPEQAFSSFELTMQAGYPESKLVAERILAQASAVSGVPAYVYRVGQIAGPTTENGHWNRDEWLPLIFRSARAVGALPQTLGPYETVDWLPVDLSAKVLVEVVESSSRSDPLATAVYHVANPHKTSFAALIPPIAEQMGLALIPFAAWVTQLEAIGQGGQFDVATLERAPALKLLDFFRALVETERSGKSWVELDTKRAEAASPTLCSAGPVTVTWLSNWVRQWGV